MSDIATAASSSRSTPSDAGTAAPDNTPTFRESIAWTLTSSSNNTPILRSRVASRHLTPMPESALGAAAIPMLEVIKKPVPFAKVPSRKHTPAPEGAATAATGAANNVEQEAMQEHSLFEERPKTARGASFNP